MPSFRSGSTALHSSYGNSVVASLLHLWSLKQVEPLTLQICANQAFTWRNQPHRRAPRSPVRKTKKSGHPKLCHAPPHASVVFGKTPTRRLRFPDFQIVFVHTRRHDGLVDHRSAYWRNMAFNRCCMRLHAPTGFLAAPPRASEHCTLLSCADSTADVIWRHMMTSSLHVSSHASTSTSATRHRMTSADLLLDSWPDLETRNQPGPISVNFDPGPVDFDFLCWPLTKSQNFRQGLSCSVFRIDSNFGLFFFIWNPKIGQLAHSSLWFLQRHSSRHF